MTVNELIEILKMYPAYYEIKVCNDGWHSIKSIDIYLDTQEKEFRIGLQYMTKFKEFFFKIYFFLLKNLLRKNVFLLNADIHAEYLKETDKVKITIGCLDSYIFISRCKFSDNIELIFKQTATADKIK